MKNNNFSIIGFDFGLKRIGVAVGQTVTQTARPLMTIQAINGMPQEPIITKLIQEWQPAVLVVGIPVDMEGKDLSVTQNARDFAEWLHQQFHLPVHAMDERLTTKDAREQLFTKGGYKALRSGQVDSVAAQLILQNWFATRA